jgi:hypothetical protein
MSQKGDFYQPQWFNVTLPEPQAVSRIVLYWEDAHAEEYCINLVKSSPFGCQTQLIKLTG